MTRGLMIIVYRWCPYIDDYLHRLSCFSFPKFSSRFDRLGNSNSSH